MIYPPRLAELTDALDLKSGGRKAVWVRLPLRGLNPEAIVRPGLRAVPKDVSQASDNDQDVINSGDFLKRFPKAVLLRIQPGTKRPAGASWEIARLKPEDRWYGPIALVPGSLGLAVADVDKGGDRAVYALVRRFGMPLLFTRSVRPERYHLYYLRVQGAPGHNRGWKLPEGSGEIRCDSGYVLLYGNTLSRLFKRLSRGTAKARALDPSNLPKAASSSTCGSGNAWLFDKGRKFLWRPCHDGMSLDTFEQILLNWNRISMRPLPESEIRFLAWRIHGKKEQDSLSGQLASDRKEFARRNGIKSGEMRRVRAQTTYLNLYSAFRQHGRSLGVRAYSRLVGLGKSQVAVVLKRYESQGMQVRDVRRTVSGGVTNTLEKLTPDPASVSLRVLLKKLTHEFRSLTGKSRWRRIKYKRDMELLEELDKFIEPRWCPINLGRRFTRTQTRRRRVDIRRAKVRGKPKYWR